MITVTAATSGFERIVFFDQPSNIACRSPRDEIWPAGQISRFFHLCQSQLSRQKPSMLEPLAELSAETAKASFRMRSGLEHHGKRTPFGEVSVACPRFAPANKAHEPCVSAGASRGGIKDLPADRSLKRILDNAAGPKSDAR